MLAILKTIAKIFRWKCVGWLPDYLRRRRKSDVASKNITGSATDIVILIVDHFEPSRRDGKKGEKDVRLWCEKYSEIASKYRDSDGIHPQHSWFYRYDYPNFNCLNTLSEYVFKRFGEIDFHLHHGNDTSETFTKTMCDGVNWFNQAGAMIDRNDHNKRKFGYIAGNWALDNGRKDDRFSGVNNELEILKKCGCYADFTFPALSISSQPKTVNTIYYATDDPNPKSYDSGVDLRVKGKEVGDLVIFQGPLCIDWFSSYIEDASFETTTPFIKERLDFWLKADVHVKGRPMWKFIKLHTHGMQHREVFLGESLIEMFDELDKIRTNNIRLHYVNAREAYNIAKAAEAGESGDAGKYRDYVIGKPLNYYLYCNRPYIPTELKQNSISISFKENKDVIIKMKDSCLVEVKADELYDFTVIQDHDGLQQLHLNGKGMCKLMFESEGIKGLGLNAVVELPYQYRI